MQIARILILTLISAFFLSFSAFAEKQLVDRVAAVVNDDIITQSELDRVLRPIFEELKQELRGEELYKKLSEIRLSLLNQLIEDRLVFQEAEQQGVQVNEAEIDAQLREFKERFKNEQELESVLHSEGLTLQSVRDRIRRQALIRSLHDAEIRAKIVISPLDVQEYYDRNPEQFVEKPRMRVRSITIKKSEEAREKGIRDETSWQGIQDIEQRIANGENFAELAKKYSEDIHAPEGGLGDWIEEGEMIPVIDDTIFQLKQGETSPVIETPMGYHLFYIEERTEGRKLALEDVRDQIFNYLFQQKSEERFDEWMEKLKSQAYISIR